MTTILELAEFARSAYGDPIPNPGNWTELTPITPNDVECYGQAYKNEKSKEIVIAYRGTRPTSLSDLLNDASLTIKIPTQAQQLAASYAETIAELNSGYKIIITGHSLGGNLAQAATAKLSQEGKDVSAVLFNAPGIGGYPHDASTSSYNVLNVVSQADVIHFAGGDHLGTELRIEAGPAMDAALYGLPLVFAGPIGTLIGVGKFLATTVGPGHSVNTIVSYLSDMNTPLGAEHWPPVGPMGSSATNPATYIDNTLNFDLKLDDHVTLRFDGASETSEVKSIFALTGPDAKGNVITIANDASNTITYERDLSDNHKLNMSAQKNGDASLSVSTEDYSIEASASQSGITKIAFSYQGASASKTFNTQTGELDYNYDSPSSVVSLHIGADGSYVYQWSTNDESETYTRSSDGTFDTTYNGAFSDYRVTTTMHLNADGTGTSLRKTVNTNGHTITDNVVINADGSTVTHSVDENGNSWEQHGAINQNVVWFNDVSTGALLTRSGAYLNGTGFHNGSAVNIGGMQVTVSSSDQAGGAVNVNVSYGYTSLYNIQSNDGRLSLGDDGSWYNFKDGLLINYRDDAGGQVDASEFGSLESAKTNDYILSSGAISPDSADVFSVSQRDAAGIWHEKVIFAPGIYDEHWTEGNIAYTKNVNTDVVATTQENLSTGELTKVVVDSVGKIQSEFIRYADRTTKSSTYNYAVDNSYVVTSIGASGTSVSKYSSAGKLAEMVVSLADGSKVTTYIYDPSSGAIIQSVEEKIAADSSVTKTYYDADGHKTSELWLGHAGSEFSSIETDYNKNGDITLEKMEKFDGDFRIAQYFYDEHNILYETIAQQPGALTTTMFATDGSSVGKTVYDDGSYITVNKTSQSEYSEFYASDGHLEHKSTSTSVGKDSTYYSTSGTVVREEHADRDGMTVKSYNPDGSRSEHYEGINGSYDKNYYSGDILSYSKGNDAHGGSWEIIYDANGHELINKWEKAGNWEIIQGETDHAPNGEVAEMVKSTDGSAIVSTTGINGVKKQVLLGSYGADHLIGDGAANFIAGSSGDDLIELGAGNNVVAYNIGDGRDTVIAANGGINVLSIGGIVSYKNLNLSKVGDDLILSFYSGLEAVVLKDWYKNSSSPLFPKLQLILDRPDPNSSDPLASQKFHEVDFAALVEKFNQVKASDPAVTTWDASGDAFCVYVIQRQ